MNLRYRTAVALLIVSPLACNGKRAPAAAHGPAGTGTGNGNGSAGSPPTLDGFEGEIALTVQGALGGAPPPTRVMNVSVLVKNGSLRVPLPDLLPVTAGMGMAYLLVFPEKKQLYAVSDNKLEATLIDLAGLLAHSGVKAPSGTAGGPTLAASESYVRGETETIAGYLCEHWSIQLTTGAMDLCVAQQSVHWLRVSLGPVGKKHPWASELMDGSHFPLRIVTRQAAAEQGRIEITRIEKKPVSASNFQIPPNYAVTSLSELLSSLGLHAAPTAGAHSR
jgi:hypothetical protein